MTEIVAVFSRLETLFYSENPVSGRYGFFRLLQTSSELHPSVLADIACRIDLGHSLAGANWSLGFKSGVGDRVRG